MSRGSGSSFVPVSRRRSSGVVFALLIVGFLGLAAGQWQSRQNVRALDFVGATGLSERALHLVSDSLIGQELRTVSLADVRMKVESIPFVESATVYITGVSTITIDVIERTPVALMSSDAGCLCYVDASGAVLPKTEARNVHNVPLIVSTTGKPLTKEQIVLCAQLLVSAQQNLDPILAASISELRVHSSNGHMVIATDEMKWKLGTVKSESIDQVFKDLNVFWKNSSQSVGAGKCKALDLRWTNHVVVQKNG